MDKSNLLFNLSIVTPDKVYYQAAVKQVDIPGVKGYFGILPNHAPLIASIASGIIKIFEQNNIRKLFISGGFADVNNNNCSILANSVIDIEALNKTEIEILLKDHESKLVLCTDESELIILKQKILEFQDVLKLI